MNQICCIAGSPTEVLIGEDGKPIEGVAVQIGEDGQPIIVAAEAVAPIPEPEVKLIIICL